MPVCLQTGVGSREHPATIESDAPIVSPCRRDPTFSPDYREKNQDDRESANEW